MTSRATGQTAEADDGAGTGRAGDAAEAPSRQQYRALKAQQPRALLLYRLGDFYEAFDDDAQIVARDARITLTSRGFGRSGRFPMAGIPHHALNHYLGRLLAAGHTVAIAEQVGEVGRGLVERAITRVLTPGTVAETALLPAAENRYLAAVLPLADRLGLAWVDVSTGEFATIELAGPTAAAALREELARLGPAECLVPDELGGASRQSSADEGGAEPATGDWRAPSGPWHVTRLEGWHFEPQRAHMALCDAFGTRTLAAYGCEALPAATGAAGAVLAYVRRTNAALVPLLTGLRTEVAGRAVSLDAATRRNLELTRGLRGGGARGSLLGVLDQTRTAMGARALRRLLGQPLRDLAELQRRQEIVAALVQSAAARAGLGTALGRVGDLERLVSRVGQRLAGVGDFLHLATGLRGAAVAAERLRISVAPALVAVGEALDACPDLLATLDEAVGEVEGGGAALRPGFWPPLDAAIGGARETRAWLTDLERSERERTGIRSLKVGFNKVFGYYIEVTRPNLALVPTDYVRKQTVAVGERFFTAALKEAEARLLAADDEIAALERAALGALAERVIAAAPRLLRTAGRLAETDALAALAEAAVRGDWTRPTLDEGDALEIVGGRHPTVEARLDGEPFIPNDCRLGGDGPRQLLVTGPNMGGKSTYLRQVALIVLLAQVGSFVPARAARVGLVDRIYTRVGAQDDIASGQSTFMVEMVETAAILHGATARSLVILDEVGRGTGTADGLAIARAVLEDLHGRLRAYALFATHYLELTALAGFDQGRGAATEPGDARSGRDGGGALPGVANVHLAVAEGRGDVVFLHAVRPGPADRAYGIQVARLAGLPPWVADRAEMLAAGGVGNEGGGDGERVGAADAAAAPALHLAHELASLDVAGLTPRAAIAWLFEQQARLRGGA